MKKKAILLGRCLVCSEPRMDDIELKNLRNPLAVARLLVVACPGDCEEIAKGLVAEIATESGLTARVFAESERQEAESKGAV